MQKRNLKVLFCIILLISLICPSVIADLAPPLDMMTTPFSPTPVAASEEENVDSFNVFPSNRWGTGSSGFSTSIADGIFRMYDTGDNTEDYYTLVRGLRALDGKIEVHFKYNISSDSDSQYDNLQIGLYNTSYLADSEIMLWVSYLKDKDGSTTNVSLRYYDVNGNIQEKAFTGSEDILADKWYVLKLSYDLLKSKFEIKLYDENNSKVADYKWQDASLDHRPEIFSAEKLNVYLRTSCKSNGKTVEGFWNYIDAPFKEREWTQTDTPTDPQWLSDGWNLAYAEEECIDTSKWELDVPYFDSCSGVMTAGFDDPTNMGVGDVGRITFHIYGVDAIDGSLDSIFSCYISHLNVGGTDLVGVDVRMGSTILYDLDTTATTQPRIEFSIVMKEDRSVISASVRVWRDITNEDSFTDAVGEIDVSDEVTNPSQEFVLSVYHELGFTGDMEWKAVIENFDFAYKFILGEIIRGVQGFVGQLLGGFFSFFQAIFIELIKLLAGIFKIVGDFIAAAVSALGPLITAMQTALDSAIGLVQGAVESLVGWIQAIAGDILALIGDFIDDGIAWCLTIIADIVGLLAAIAFAIYDGLFFNFGFGEAPDLLALAYSLSVGFIQLVLNIPVFITDWTNFIFGLHDLFTLLGLVYFLILPVLQGDSIGGFFSAMLDNMGSDVTFGLSAFGFGVRVPVVLPWSVIAITTVFRHAVFAGFF